MLRGLTATVAVAGLVLIVGCGEETPDQQPPPCQLERADENGEPFESLGDYCFFRGDPATHDPSEGVVAYDVTAELYADRSHKQRFIVLPDDHQIGFDATDPWAWPDETILIKTFYYPDDKSRPDGDREILETRLLVKRDGVWEPEIYVWDDDQSDADHHNYGRRVDVEFTDRDGDVVDIDYRIPNSNDCASCHNQDGDLQPLGPRTRQMTRPYDGDSQRPPQVRDLADREMFDDPVGDVDDLPALVDFTDEDQPLDDRARSYLDANCGHCHSPQGRASSSNMFLDWDEDNDANLGVCKTPVAAGQGAGGRDYGIVPGEPDESILVYRMEATDPEIKMPELPITTVDETGVELIRDWIASMEPVDCD